MNLLAKLTELLLRLMDWVKTYGQRENSRKLEQALDDVTKADTSAKKFDAARRFRNAISKFK